MWMWHSCCCTMLFIETSQQKELLESFGSVEMLRVAACYSSLQSSPGISDVTYKCHLQCVRDFVVVTFPNIFLFFSLLPNFSRFYIFQYIVLRSFVRSLVRFVYFGIWKRSTSKHKHFSFSVLSAFCFLFSCSYNSPKRKGKRGINGGFTDFFTSSLCQFASKILIFIFFIARSLARIARSS